MRIKGFEPFSASDWPGRLAAVIFCGGCNLACGYCHNSRLIHDAAPWLDEEEVFAELERRRFMLDGVVVSGGESTLQPTYETVKVQTPLGKAPTALSPERIVLGTIFRAGLPFHQGFLNYFDRAENAFVSAYRYYKDEECKEVGIKIEYIAAPELTGKTLIIADPMLATGGSMELALKAFHTKGEARDIHFACVIAAKQGVEYLEKVFAGRDDITLWCAAIDKKLNDHSYIVPGLGDAGDLAFGEKMSESFQWD